MTTQNLALYRLLVKFGATETEAETAAAMDTSQLATKGDLRIEIAELKADLTWRILLAMGAQIAIFSAIVGALKFVR